MNKQYSLMITFVGLFIFCAQNVLALNEKPLEVKTDQVSDTAVNDRQRQVADMLKLINARRNPSSVNPVTEKMWDGFVANYNNQCADDYRETVAYEKGVGRAFNQVYMIKLAKEQAEQQIAATEARNAPSKAKTIESISKRYYTQLAKKRLTLSKLSTNINSAINTRQPAANGLNILMGGNFPGFKGAGHSEKAAKIYAYCADKALADAGIRAVNDWGCSFIGLSQALSPANWRRHGQGFERHCVSTGNKLPNGALGVAANTNLKAELKLQFEALRTADYVLRASSGPIFGPNYRAIELEEKQRQLDVLAIQSQVMLAELVQRESALTNTNNVQHSNNKCLSSTEIASLIEQGGSYISAEGCSNSIKSPQVLLSDKESKALSNALRTGYIREGQVKGINLVCDVVLEMTGSKIVAKSLQLATKTISNSQILTGTDCVTLYRGLKAGVIQIGEGTGVINVK